MQVLYGVCHFHSETGTEGGYWAFQDEKFIFQDEHGRADWSYEGLHILEDGDWLTIFDPDDPDRVVWTGTIALIQLGLFTHHAFGYWIHADQEGVDREVWAEWFLKEYPATLVRGEGVSDG